MAIKLPDPGNGIPEQKTGNDEWTNMKIVRDNFADQSNAASRLVGEQSGRVLPSGAYGLGTPSWHLAETTQLPVYNTRFLKIDTESEPTFTVSDRMWGINMPTHTAGGGAASTMLGTDGDHFYSFKRAANGATSQAKFYTTSNTTTDVNRNIKTSSPVLQVFKDGVKKIHEANQLPIKFTRNGVGDYTIEGTTGLRENDWQIVIPKDDHDNQMIAFTMKDDNGTIHLKTYKRIFSMETFLFGPDLKSPVDIPDGLWIDLHFNDLPQEQTDEPAV